MPSLKELKNSIGSVKSTQKITSAMKMVAVSKLKKAQENAEKSRPYTNGMAEIVSHIAGRITLSAASPKLLAGTGSDQVILLIIFAADRGLCGGFNSALIRYASAQIKAYKTQGKNVKLITVGRKAYDLLKRNYSDIILESFSDWGRGPAQYKNADILSNAILTRFNAGEFDCAKLCYNHFQSVIAQTPIQSALIPFERPVEALRAEKQKAQHVIPALYEYEPSEEGFLEALLPKNITVQLYKALLETAAGEHGARMSAMDSATRNAGELIDKLTLKYNRSRQAAITSELIEIISGAEAV